MTFKSKSKGDMDHTSQNSLPQHLPQWALGTGHSILTPSHPLTQEATRTAEGLGKMMESTLGNKYLQFTERMT